MDRIDKILSDGLTPARIPGENAILPHLTRPTLDMKLYLALLHNIHLLLGISGYITDLSPAGPFIISHPLPLRKNGSHSPSSILSEEGPHTASCRFVKHIGQ